MSYGLIFEKVGDINSLYPYICVYMQGESNPFMEVGVTEEKQLAFTFYVNDKNVALSVEQWDEIAKRGREFLPRAIADEDASM
ncbi:MULTISPECIES: hypothetical protein [Burkholderia]|uniref:hypothetical protein n=1 Tax=Burkholderia TaxID=32008 RepID=UPI00075CA217|nr:MULTISPECIES: hypothetical protein [Burkholderia]KVF29728.1 hypothetical protein WJ08_19325 [Burkholderia vietnamiensis]KVF36573.1 hypothetical protein WJ10_27325 [Burkholderia vietnamiensis]KVR65440.1 hypothetical protein WK24_19630 [Burkholderia vietnamiensis]KVS01259.1 hypothetical protein WK29_29090 [Burkholderia vietnamiensis]MBH9643231.1 hypothetical protein [Burkholderia vietnamiensis]